MNAIAVALLSVALMLGSFACIDAGDIAVGVVLMIMSYHVFVHAKEKPPTP